MTFFKYIKDSFRTILCFLLIILTINLILISSTDIDKSILDILYMNILLFSIFIGFLVMGFIKWKHTYRDLKNALDNGNSIEGYIPNGEKLEQLLIRKIIDFKNKEKFEEVKDLKRDLEEINDYITKWVHEIKIPLSVCELMADRIEEEGLYDTSKELRQEVERINFLINQVLYTSRASSYSRDFIVEEVNLGASVRSVIKNNINSFLSKKIEVEVGDLDFNIFTDSKWTYYILEQIINNACKYVDIHGKIEIFAKETDESIILCIRDNGIGIPAKDIDRIFDRGFTGDNGRRIKKSTGMGLYICKKVADKLNINIQATSEVSRYTEFRIIFYKLSDYLNVTEM